MKTSLTWALVAALAIASGCSKPSETTDAKRSPKPPPADSTSVPAGLHVDVEIDGAPAPAIDAAKLAATKPDFSDDEHRAWRVTTLVGTAAARPGVVVSAMGDQGLSLEMRPGVAATDPAPVLSLNRRGDLHVGLVTPDDPFPGFHGKGGRLNRPGDPLPHLVGPTRLRIYVPPPAGPAASASSSVGTGTGGGIGNGGGGQASADAAPLKVVVTGGAPTAWTPAALATVSHFTIHADGADKDAWSLRDVVHTLVGPHARVASAVDGDGTRARIDAKAWSDAKKTPVLRINRRGMYKIEWVDKDGNMTNDDDVRDVKTVEIVP